MDSNVTSTNVTLTDFPNVTLTNSSSICSLSDTIQLVRNNLCFVAYVIISPIYFTIVVSTRGICLFAFFRQYKKEKAYGYQIFTALSDILEAISVALCMSTLNNWSGFRLPGTTWFQSNYVLMWYSGHLSILYQGVVTSTLFIHVSMAADRAFALIRPYRYKTLNHKRYQIIALCVSYFLGMGTSFFDVVRLNVRSKGDLYEIYVDADFVASTYGIGWAMGRNALRILGNLALIALNVTMIIYYRLTTNKVNATDMNAHRVATRKGTQRNLVLLTLCQSTFMSADMTMYNAYYTLYYTVPGFPDCFGKLMAPMNDIVLQVGAILEFFALLAISKQLRQTIFSSFQCKKVQDSSGPGVGGSGGNGTGAKVSIRKRQSGNMEHN